MSKRVFLLGFTLAGFQAVPEAESSLFRLPRGGVNAVLDPNARLDVTGKQAIGDPLFCGW